MSILNRRVTALDGLRTIAVGLVIMRHVMGRAVPGGFVGVDLFFVLSGYLITSILSKEFATHSDISLGHFYLRRASRLMPALGVLLLAVILTQSIGLHHFVITPDVEFSATYMMNWARAFAWGDNFVLGHTWSLGVEEQFYFLWPPILLVVLRWRPAAAPAVASAMALLSVICSSCLYLNGAPWERTYNGFDTRAVELLFGCALAFLPLDGRLAAALARFWFIPTIALVAAALSLHESSPFLPLGGYGALAIVGGWLIVAILAEAPLVVLLEQPAMVYLGRISYGLYLWHFPLLRLCSALGLSHWTQIAVVPPLTFVLAALSYHFVETPILNATRDRLTLHGIAQPA